LKLADFNTFIWDFDGVIKESTKIKEETYADLFSHFGHRATEFVKTHHKANAGISRFEKIPYYLEQIGAPLDDGLVAKYLDDFSKSVVQNVINSPWVPGVQQFLEKNHTFKSNFLISGTPESELNFILKSLKLDPYFEQVYGSPQDKSKVTKSIILNYEIDLNFTVYIGDSLVDMNAAAENNIKFCLRKNCSNFDQKFSYYHFQIDDFVDE
jgi:phosphoglycolate phosphatase-like HAD superfamily hydrolase